MREMRLWILSDALARIVEEANRQAPLETGGLLLGYERDSEIVVTEVIGPGPAAGHGATTFIPDHEHQETELARLYEASGRRHTYLGDWHSHPGGSATLSRTDRRTLRRIARSPQARAPRPLMVVVHGGSSGEWQIAASRLLPWSIRMGSRLARVETTVVEVS
jgi:integrative and conjugative element protein (TIGR02256 family)